MCSSESKYDAHILPFILIPVALGQYLGVERRLLRPIKRLARSKARCSGAYTRLPLLCHGFKLTQALDDLCSQGVGEIQVVHGLLLGRREEFVIRATK